MNNFLNSKIHIENPMGSVYEELNNGSLGSDLCVDDIIYKLSLGCPLGKDKQCKLKEIKDLRDIPSEKRYFHIMNMDLSLKFRLLSKHYSCYNNSINYNEIIME